MMKLSDLEHVDKLSKALDQLDRCVAAAKTSTPQITYGNVIVVLRNEATASLQKQIMQDLLERRQDIVTRLKSLGVTF